MGVSVKEKSYINLKNQINPFFILLIFESIQYADDNEKSQYDKIVGVDTANYEQMLDQRFLDQVLDCCVRNQRIS